MSAKGYIQLYTGNGKGKTTAALGLALRAAGAGKKVFIAQFVKGMPYAEFNSLAGIAEIRIKQYGLDCFIVNKPTEADIKAARKGLDEIKNIITNNSCDVLILDELCIALYYRLFTLTEVLELLQNKPQPMEIVITGRYAPEALIEQADLVTEMTETKHYFHKGVQAREGIEY